MHIYIYVCVCVCVCVCVPGGVNLYIYIYICIYIYTYIHTCIHAYIHTYIHTYIYTYIHTYLVVSTSILKLYMLVSMTWYGPPELSSAERLSKVSIPAYLVYKATAS
jgi:hypothetical protein